MRGFRIFFERTRSVVHLAAQRQSVLIKIHYHFHSSCLHPPTAYSFRKPYSTDACGKKLEDQELLVGSIGSTSGGLIGKPAGLTDHTDPLSCRQLSGVKLAGWEGLVDSNCQIPPGTALQLLTGSAFY